MWAEGLRSGVTRQDLNTSGERAEAETPPPASESCLYFPVLQQETFVLGESSGLLRGALGAGRQVQLQRRFHLLIAGSNKHTAIQVI